jgi:hypothetical protein
VVVVVVVVVFVVVVVVIVVGVVIFVVLSQFVGSHGTLKGNLSKCDNQGQDSYLIQRGKDLLCVLFCYLRTHLLFVCCLFVTCLTGRLSISPIGFEGAIGRVQGKAFALN